MTLGRHYSGEGLPDLGLQKANHGPVEAYPGPHALGDRESETQRLIRSVCTEIADILVAKNRAYGNSATDPVRIFSSANPSEQLLVRIDDKLSRIARGDALTEDVVLDLIGYLVLLRVQGRIPADPAPPARFQPETSSRGPRKPFSLDPAPPDLQFRWQSDPDALDKAFEREKADMIGRMGDIDAPHARDWLKDGPISPPSERKAQTFAEWLLCKP